MALEDVVPIIQTTLAPMFLITGAGIYLNFIQARLFRAVDRVQNLVSGETSGDVDREVPYQMGRIRLLRKSVALGSVSMMLTALAGVFIIVSFYLRREMDPWILTSFALALVALAVSLVYGLRDTYRSYVSMGDQLWSPDADFEGD